MPILPINSLMPVSPVDIVRNTPETQKLPGQSEFSKFLNDALQELDNSQKIADKASMDLATGQAPDIHNTIVALEKANLNFSLAVEVRNKALDAYHEIMRMQI